MKNTKVQILVYDIAENKICYSGGLDRNDLRLLTGLDYISIVNGIAIDLFLNNSRAGFVLS